MCSPYKRERDKRLPKSLLILSLWAGSMLALPPLHADEDGDNDACSQTAQAAFKAMINGAMADYWIGVGHGHNQADPELGMETRNAADEALQEAIALAQEQLEARLWICDAVGEAPYEPTIDASRFVDFEAVLEGDEAFTPNPYFPLRPGMRREYLVMAGDGNIVERIFVEVLAETKEILDVHCLVVRDRVWEIDEEGAETLIEDTLDWYAQDIEGNVWYFGEIVLNFEDGELDNLDGSWKVGKGQAQAGFLMLTDPRAGDVYRQEFAFAEAEDMAEVVSRGQAQITVPAGQFDQDILRTRDWTPIEPDVDEFKYYAPGIGMILEEKPSTGERVELNHVVMPE